MGMFTELNINLELRRGVPDDVLATLRYLTNTPGIGPTEDAKALTDDYLVNGAGECRPFRFLRGRSAYFAPGRARSELSFNGENHQLSVLCFIKSTTTLLKFLAWLAPHVNGDGYIGTFRYEEAGLPTLVSVENGKAYMSSVIIGLVAEIPTPVLDDSPDPA